MNAESPVGGLAGTLKSLNGDRAYGLALLCALGLLLAPELAGPGAREALQYDRGLLGRGEWWRLLSAHFVHLDLEHAVLNGLGLVLMWGLFARDYAPLRWLAIYLASALAVGVGLWFFNPELDWYVGASGALHGVMAAGTLAHLRRGDLDGWILALFIVGKLGYEQFAGAMPFAGSPDTIVDAHLYGATGGGVAAALLFRPKVSRA
jgi:rhomboid family GlyGly-CTERM serine protease